MNDEVYTLTEYKGAIYAGGWFYSPGSKVAKWDGVKWDTVVADIHDKSGSGYVINLTVVNDELYAMGSFSYCNGFQADNIVKWNGSISSPVDAGIKGPYVYCGTSFNNQLNVGGGFDTAGTVISKNFAIWNGTNWTTGNLRVDGSTNTLYTFGSKLYLGGSFKSVNGTQVNGICIWDGTKVQALGKGVNGYVSSILVH